MPIILLVLLSVLILKSEQKLNLEQVVILSRHNIRTPLSNNLNETTPKKWPHWKEKNGYLTEKGALLEGYMGVYFAMWLRNEQVLPIKCPSEQDFYVYANIAQRTMKSAHSFISKAFPACNITVHHADDTDPIFNPVIHNSTAEFKKEALIELDRRIKGIHLTNSYNLLENILDYSKSSYCLTKHKCNLATDKNKAVIRNETKPAIIGPLKISKTVIDSFLMEYYEGFSNKTVAWGQLSSTEVFRKVLEISKIYHSILLNTTILATDMAQPMVKYISDLFFNNSPPKTTLIMGHDANIYTVLNSLRIKPFILRKQLVMVPPGGKVVFQKWTNNNTGSFLKIEYVYQRGYDMRKGSKLSMANPPEFQLLELKDCNTDKHGFCQWDCFERVLNSRNVSN